MLVQRQGDWRSVCYKEYIEVSNEVSLNCNRSMLECVDHGFDLYELPIAAVQPAMQPTMQPAAMQPAMQPAAMQPAAMQPADHLPTDKAPRAAETVS